MNEPSEQRKALSQPDFPLSSELDRCFRTALGEKIFSGASLLVGDSEKIIFQQCWGRTKSDGIPVDAATRFDLASLTKPLVTTLLVMQAVHAGKFGLDDCLASFFPAGLVPLEKRSVTIRQLLNHSSGLAAYHPFHLELIEVPERERGPRLLDWIMRMPLQSRPGRRSRYSDLGFLVLGAIIQSVLHGPLDVLAQQFVFMPLGVEELGFVRLIPPSNPAITPAFLSQPEFAFAATEWCPWRRRLVQGEVHDENAYCLGGVAPHAGLFGTGQGIYTVLSHLLGAYCRKSQDALFPPDLLEHFWTRANADEVGTWVLGFDTPSSHGSSAGRYFSLHSVGHLGFTGTSFWMDLDRQVLLVLLTNRVYPTRKNEKIKIFRPMVHDLAMKAFYAHSRH